MWIVGRVDDPEAGLPLEQGDEIRGVARAASRLSNC